MEKDIIYFGQKAKIVCDGKCDKAWGLSNRPKIQLSENDDDIVWLSDDELGVAPKDPGTYEGDCGKPIYDDQKMNKWCTRECERCKMSDIGKFNEPLILPDWSKRVYNLLESEEKYR